MNIIAQIKIFLKRMQDLPEDQKKIILWLVVGILAVAMGFFWVRTAFKNFSEMGEGIQNIKIVEIETQDTPQIEVNNNAADWKIYKNDKYNFEVGYPSDWIFREYDSGVAFSPLDNSTGVEPINIGFYNRGSTYCKISFDDYVRIAGPAEIQNFESLNTIVNGISYNGVEIYQVRWNYTDMQGVGQISLPITYIETNEELCGSIEAFLNDNNYSDIYNKIILTFNLIK